MSTTHEAPSQLTRESLREFQGDDVRWRHVFKSVIYTPGVRHVMTAGEAHWLINDIAVYLLPEFMKPEIEKDPRLAWYVFFRLEVNNNSNRTAVLTARADSDCEPFVRKIYWMTAFPLDSIDIWAQFDGECWTLLLPSEY